MNCTRPFRAGTLSGRSERYARSRSSGREHARGALSAGGLVVRHVPRRRRRTLFSADRVQRRTVPGSLGGHAARGPRAHGHTCPAYLAGRSASRNLFTPRARMEGPRGAPSGGKRFGIAKPRIPLPSGSPSSQQSTQSSPPGGRRWARGRLAVRSPAHSRQGRSPGKALSRATRSTSS